MRYVYLGLAAMVAILFCYRKIANSKKTDQYLPKQEKKTD